MTVWRTPRMSLRKRLSEAMSTPTSESNMPMNVQRTTMKRRIQLEVHRRSTRRRKPYAT